jgi:hypothetical protein
MPIQPTNVLVLDGYDISVTGFTTDYYPVFDTETVAIEVIIQNGVAPSGTFIIEMSCEYYCPIQFGQVVDNSQTITDNSIIIWNFGDVGWNWMRVIYERTSGTGEVTLYINKKTLYNT